MLLAVLPLLAALGACQTYPGPYGPPGYPEPYPQPYPQPYPEPGPTTGDYRAMGTEPFWDLTIGRDLVFTDRGNNLQVVQPAPRPIIAVAGEIYQTRRINVNIVHARCSDGMSDRSYPDQVQLTVDGRAYRGCGGPSSFFAQTGAALSVPRLARTNWTVVTINGRPVPRSGYYVNFAPDRLSAKFGCNQLGAGYSVTRDLLRPGAIMATRMACPDMSFENAGNAILSMPMTIANVGERLTLSNRNGAITMVRAH